MKNKISKSLGPIVLSALSLFLSFLILQPIAFLLDPSFDLLASRGISKVAFITMVIYQILLFILLQPQNFLTQFFERNLLFFRERWLPHFSLFFISFFSLHAFLISLLYLSGYLTYVPHWGIISLSLIGKTIFGLFVVFMLAWTEELIFRGTIFPYLTQYYSTLTSLFVTSFIFMIVHNLRNPLALLTTDWKLGLGLFLLGLLLNQIFVITKKLYTGMGLHAGLVFVKVILRRAPFLEFVDQNKWTWWVHKDLRQSHLIHILFIITIFFIFFRYRKKFASE